VADDTTGATFEPDRVAYLEVAGWRAYYDRKWVLCFRLLAQLAREQFHLSRLRALQAAYYITRASVAWAPVEHDTRVVRRYIRKFYRQIRQYGRGFTFDPTEVARLEFVYWDVHRRLSSELDERRAPLVDSLAKLHAALFGIAPEAAYESGLERSRSTTHVDSVTGKRSTDIEADWQAAEEHLRLAYRSLEQAVHSS
jgi:hypothetical protein